MCRGRLSKDPSQEDLPMRSPTGCTGGPALGAGPQLPACCSYISPSQSNLKEPTCSDPFKRSLFSKHRFSPTPLSSGNSHRVGNAGWKPLCSAQPSARSPGPAPAARSRCCRAREPFHPPISCLHFARALLHAAAPSQVTAHRFSCAIDTCDAPRLDRMVSEHCHPTPIVTHHVSRPRGTGYLLAAGNPPPFGTGAGSYPTDSCNARRLTARLSRGRLGHGAGT